MVARGAWRTLVWPSVFALAGMVLLVQLGNWQMRRLEWKEALIARVEERAAGVPAPLPARGDWAALDPDAYEYRPVRLRGRFEHEAEAHLYTVLSQPRSGPHAGPGYWVLTPLALEGGGYVVVNRGFVPDARKAARTREEGQVEGEVEVTGLMRAPQEPGPFTPDNDPDANQWYTRAPDEIARVHGLDGVAPFVVDAAHADPPGGLPQGGETRLTFSNRHLGYALTWYGLAGTLMAVYAAFAWQRLRGREW